MFAAPQRTAAYPNQPATPPGKKSNHRLDRADRPIAMHENSAFDFPVTSLRFRIAMFPRLHQIQIVEPAHGFIPFLLRKVTADDLDHYLPLKSFRLSVADCGQSYQHLSSADFDELEARSVDRKFDWRLRVPCGGS